MPDDARPTPDAAAAVSDVDGPVAVPDPAKARMVAKFEADRIQYKKAQAAREQDHKREAMAALSGRLGHLRAETAPKRDEVAPEAVSALDPEDRAGARARGDETWRGRPDIEARRIAVAEEKEDDDLRRKREAPDRAVEPEQPETAAPTGKRAQLREQLRADLGMSDAEVIAAVAKWVWFDAYGEPCPKARIPTPENLVSWLSQCDRGSFFKTVELLSELYGTFAWWESKTAKLIGDLSCRVTARKPDVPDFTDLTELCPVATLPGDNSIRPLREVTLLWIIGHRKVRFVPLPPGIETDNVSIFDDRGYAGIQQEERGHEKAESFLYPLEPLIDSWQRSPPLVEADARRHISIPRPLAATRHVTRRRDDTPNLPFDEEDFVPADAPRIERVELAYLPAMEPPPSKLPLAMLNIFDFGLSRGRGGPVPAAQRAGWDLLLMPKPGDWHADQATLLPTHAELAAGVWPGTVIWREDLGRYVGYKAVKHGKDLYQCARWLNDPDNAVWWARNGQSRPLLLVTFFAPPVAPYAANETVGVHVVLPDRGRKHGPQIDNHLRCVLAATSYRQHRVYLVAVDLWDRYATFRGHLVQLTLPEVKRDPAGYVVDAKDKVVIDRRGRPTRDPRNARAIQTGERALNPAADNAYVWLEGNDVILIAHHQVAETRRERNFQRKRSLTTLEELRIRRRGAVLDYAVRYRSGTLTGSELASLKDKERPPSGELEAVRLLPAAAHFAAHQQRRVMHDKTRGRHRPRPL